MQLACIEFARNVCGIPAASSREFDPKAPEPVIDLMEEQKKLINKGATMRLGAYACAIEKDTLAQRVYQDRSISERHRHRYEFNNIYRDRLSDRGMVFSGLSPDGVLVEIIELPNHPYFIACQFHPEFKSRPMAPHPLFTHFIKASLRNAQRQHWNARKTDETNPPEKSNQILQSGEA